MFIYELGGRATWGEKPVRNSSRQTSGHHIRLRPAAYIIG
jgi:hypothetical protein